ncbi:hypothetical protein MFIFM68171_10144 [Madurella fahalii]|uniref:Uncharacterized protein n=1 Tax=Madurella fahalii TaxID=1157608 RepID=A0ABQ0GQA7_9PEZI
MDVSEDDEDWRRNAEALAAMQRALENLQWTIGHHYRDSIREINGAVADMTLSFTMCIHALFGEAGHVESGGVAAIIQILSRFASDLDDEMWQILADSVSSEDQRAAARREFYERVIGNIMGPLAALLHAFPHIILWEKCVMYALHLIWKLCMHLRQHAFAAYLHHGGRRPRRASL